MTDNDKHPTVTMPSFEQFEEAGPVVQFMTKVLGTMVERIHAMEHRLECIENGGCAYNSGASSDEFTPIEQGEPSGE